MSLWIYKYFVDVVECKSFTKAGKKNFVSQTAVSQQIADLEKKVGGKLLYRERGTLCLTELGEVVYERAKEMLFINSQMEQEIESLKDRYVIKIGIDSSINKRVWRRMQEMLDTYYDEADFRFSKIDCMNGTTLLEEGTIDLYIGYGLYEAHMGIGLEHVGITQSPIGVYVGQDSTLPRERPLTLEDLAGYTRYGSEEYPCSIAVGSEPEFHKLCGKVTCVDNAETMKLKVEFNDGYAFVDSVYFSECHGDIRPVEGLDIPQKISVFYRKKAGQKKKLREVMERIREMMEKDSAA